MILLQNISIYVFLISLILGLLSLWSMGKVSGKYYDACIIKLGQRLPIVIRVGCSGASARAGCYLLLVLLNGNPLVRNQSKWYPELFIKSYRINFGDVGYRKLARKRDWVMAILFWGSALCFLLSATMMCVISMILGTN
jgi:hypothetical protein